MGEGIKMGKEKNHKQNVWEKRKRRRKHK